MVDHLLASQQSEPLNAGQAWDHYFPWDAPNIFEEFETRSSFLSFLRWSYYRPRDLLTMLDLMQHLVREARSNTDHLTYSHFDDPRFRRAYSEYLLGELKDHLTFYYGFDEYEIFLKFFEFLDGKVKFTFEEFKKAFSEFRETGLSTSTELPQFMADGRIFLQFLYDLNVICYVEQPENDKPYVRWCFRQRSHANISPKVKEGLSYQVFYGLSKALNVGQKFKRGYR